MGSNPITHPKKTMKELESNSTVFKRQHRKAIAKKIGGCDRCQPHSGDNYSLKGGKPKSDKHKTQRKGR